MDRKSTPNGGPADTRPLLARVRIPRRADVPVLRVAAGRNLLRFATLGAGRGLEIGRDDACGLSIEDDSVSRRHARVTLGKDGVPSVVDLGSTNGTTLNGKPIRRGHLRHGDRLQLGDLCLVYEMLSSEEVAHLRQVTERLQAKDRDPLTGLLTRAYLQEELPAQLERCQEQAIPLGCLFIDVDRFKAINDGFGHAVGDDVLVSTARIVALGVRDRDACVRYGGEEFLVVLEGATEYRAAVVANRVRQAVAKHDWSRTAAELAVTVSIGVAVCQPKESQRAWLERADQALYRAKQAGRNRVVRAKTVRTVRPK